MIALFLPSHGEGWGLPIFEALACGLPVITTGYGAPNETLRDDNGEPLPGVHFVDWEEGEAKTSYVYLEDKKWFEYWKQNRMDFYLTLGIKKENLRFRDHSKDERAHYARAATEIEYNAPFGWSEFMGIHYRGDFDISRQKTTLSPGFISS